MDPSSAVAYARREGPRGNTTRVVQRVTCLSRAPGGAARSREFPMRGLPKRRGVGRAVRVAYHVRGSRSGCSRWPVLTGRCPPQPSDGSSRPVATRTRFGVADIRRRWRMLYRWSDLMCYFGTQELLHKVHSTPRGGLIASTGGYFLVRVEPLRTTLSPWP